MNYHEAIEKICSLLVAHGYKPCKHPEQLQILYLNTVRLGCSVKTLKNSLLDFFKKEYDIFSVKDEFLTEISYILLDATLS